MYSPLCQNIRELTLQAETLINKDEIEHCHNVLVERQCLLDKLMCQYQSSQDNQEFTLTFIELIRWIQQQDLVNQAKIAKLKEKNKENSVAQLKINKALHHYKNIT